MDYTVAEFVFLTIFIVIVRIIPVLFWVLVIRSIFNCIRRSASRKYFKSNVVSSNQNFDKYLNTNTKEKNNVYKDVSKEQLEIFNTTDINTLKDYFYDIFVKFEIAYENDKYEATFSKILYRHNFGFKSW